MRPGFVMLLALGGGILSAGPLAARTGERFSMFVVARDVSKSMDHNDPPFVMSSGQRTTLGDLGFAQMLRTLPFAGRTYVGVHLFHDRIARELPVRPLFGDQVDETMINNLVDSLRTPRGGRTDLDLAIGKSAEMIAEGRQRLGLAQAPAAIVVISDGNPDGAAEILRQGDAAPVIRRTRDALEKLNIATYTIIVNGASHGLRRPVRPLNEAEQMAEIVMERIARAGGGNAFRLTSEQGFAQIFIELLELASTAAFLEASHDQGLFISRHHARIILVGPRPSQLLLPGPPHTDLLQRQAEAGFQLRPVEPSDANRIWVLDRPPNPALIDRYWHGVWQLLEADKQPYSGRVFALADVNVRWSRRPRSTMFVFEQFEEEMAVGVDALNAAEIGLAAATQLERDDLSCRLRVTPATDSNPRIFAGKYDATVERFVFPQILPFETPGQQVLHAELIHHVDGQDVVVARTSCPVQVVDSGLRTRIVPLSPTDDQIHAGDRVIVQVQLPGHGNRSSVRGRVQLTGAAPGETHFEEKTGADGTISSPPLTVDSFAKRLAGMVELEIDVEGTWRRLRLPFEQTLGEQKMQTACEFDSDRAYLLANEFFIQQLSVTVHPVHPDLVADVKARFPGTLTGSLDLRGGPNDGTSIELRISRDRDPIVDQHTLKAVYHVSSDRSIPAADCASLRVGPVLGTMVQREFQIRLPRGEQQVESAFWQRGQATSTLYLDQEALFRTRWGHGLGAEFAQLNLFQQGDQPSLVLTIPLSISEQKAEASFDPDRLGKGIYSAQLKLSAPSGHEIVAGQKGAIILDAGAVSVETAPFAPGRWTLGPGIESETHHAFEPVEIVCRSSLQGFREDDDAHRVAIGRLLDHLRLSVSGMEPDSHAVVSSELIAPATAGEPVTLRAIFRFWPQQAGHFRWQIWVDDDSQGDQALAQAAGQVSITSPRFQCTATDAAGKTWFDSATLARGDANRKLTHNSLLDLTFAVSVFEAAVPVAWVTPQLLVIADEGETLDRRDMELASDEYHLAHTVASRGKRFQIVFWKRGDDPALVPPAFLCDWAGVDVTPPQVDFDSIQLPPYLTQWTRSFPMRFSIAHERLPADVPPGQLELRFRLPGMTDWVRCRNSNVDDTLVFQGPDFIPAWNPDQNFVNVQFELSRSDGTVIRRFATTPDLSHAIALAESPVAGVELSTESPDSKPYLPVDSRFKIPSASGPLYAHLKLRPMGDARAPAVSSVRWFHCSQSASLALQARRPTATMLVDQPPIATAGLQPARVNTLQRSSIFSAPWYHGWTDRHFLTAAITLPGEIVELSPVYEYSVDLGWQGEFWIWAFALTAIYALWFSVMRTIRRAALAHREIELEGSEGIQVAAGAVRGQSFQTRMRLSQTGVWDELWGRIHVYRCSQAGRFVSLIKALYSTFVVPLLSPCPTFVVLFRNSLISIPSLQAALLRFDGPHPRVTGFVNNHFRLLDPGSAENETAFPAIECIFDQHSAAAVKGRVYVLVRDADAGQANAAHQGKSH